MATKIKNIEKESHEITHGKSVTILEKTNAVKESLIAIRPYFNESLENMGLENYEMSLFDGVFHSESISCLERNGIQRYVTGLNEFAPEIKNLPDNERKDKIKEIRNMVCELEKELASNVIKEDDPEFWSKVQIVRPDNGSFWDKIEFRCGNDPIYIDPKVDPYDRIKLIAIEAGGFSMIAKNLEHAQSTGKFKFYLDRVVETVGTRTKDVKVKNKALGILSDLYDTDKTRLLHIVKLIDYNSSQFRDDTPIDVLYEIGDDYINGKGSQKDKTKASKNFIDYSKSTMEMLKMTSLVKDALAFNYLTSKADGYIYEKETDAKIATSREGVVSHLKSPTNDEQLTRIMEKVTTTLNS